MLPPVVEAKSSVATPPPPPPIPAEMLWDKVEEFYAYEDEEDYIDL